MDPRRGSIGTRKTSAYEVVGPGVKPLKVIQQPTESSHAATGRVSRNASG